MKKLLLLFLIPMLALGFACGDGDDNDGDNGGVLDPGNGGDDGNGGGGGATASVYYPMKTDAYWVMTYTDKENGTVVDEGEETLRVAGKETVDGNEYWKFVDENDVLDSHVRIANNILYIYHPTLFATKMASVMKAAGASQMPDLTGELPMIDFNVGSGKSWTIAESSFAESGVSYSINWTGTYLGTENVTVPAGTFANCRKYRLLMVTTSTYNNFSFTSETESIIWLAANVGAVKTVDSDEYEEETYEYTTVLKEYNIP